MFTMLTLALAALFGTAASTAQQNAAIAAPPSFEVASVKPAVAPEAGPVPLCIVPCDPQEHLKVDGSRVDIRYYTLRDLIQKAYHLKPYQLSSENRNTISPNYWQWMMSERFDIVAKIPEGFSTDEVPEMLRDLLADRFKLALHREKRELPVYALVVDKKGLKLKGAAVNADAPVPDTPGSTTLDTPQGEARFSNEGYAIASGPYGPMRAYADRNGTIHTDLLKVTMQALVELLHQDRPVIDMTNLKGYYQFSMERLSARAASAAGEPMLTPDEVARQALARVGLRLDPSTAPLEVVVIDHLEKSPSEN
jgi:uncharacterized protein (TIGR03435 family)